MSKTDVVMKECKVSKHTPGPWVCEYGMVWKETDTGFEIPIARMDREIGNGTKPTERDANAYLIATAPELLEACKTALAWIDNAVEAIGIDAMIDSMPNNCGGRHQLRDAIAKATEEVGK